MTLKQKLGPHQADPVDMGRIEAFELGEAGDIDHDPNQFTSGCKRRPIERGGYLPNLRLLGAALTIDGSHIGVGVDNEKPSIRIEKCVRTLLEMIDVHSHNHRHAARSGENCDMAAGGSPAQHHAAVTPIGGQKRRRRHIVGRDDNS